MRRWAGYALLRGARRPFLPGGGGRSRAAARLPAALGPRACPSEAHTVLGPVLGRPVALRRGARTSAPADAPCPLRDRARRARPVAAPHDGGGAVPGPREDGERALLENFAMAAEGMRNHA